MINFRQHLLNERLENLFSNRSVGMISAARTDKTPAENDVNHESLRGDLERRGHIVHDAEGVWDGHKEKSFLVAHHESGNDGGKVEASLKHLGKKYNQDAILHKPYHSDKASLHHKDGSVTNAGTFHSGAQNGNYTKTRGQTFHFTEQFIPAIP
jgi:hypothetical protein